MQDNEPGFEAVSRNEGVSSTADAPMASSASKRCPLSAPQQEIWIEAQRGPDASRAYNESFYLELRGPLDAPALEGALNDVIARHESLRTAFSADGTEQRIQPELRIRISVVDLSDLGSGVREERCDKILAAEADLAFDLTQWPLVRAQLLRLGSEDHRLVITSHHLLLDGWSAEVLIGELGQCYSARVENGIASLPKPMQYSEWVSAQARPSAVQAASDAERFWVERFAEPAAALELPLDRPLPAVRSYVSGMERMKLPADLAERLRKAAAAHRSTLFAGLMTAYQVFLARMTGQTDVVVGIMTATQAGVEEPLIGHGAHMLPLRVEVTPEERFGDVVRKTGLAVAEVMEHRSCGFARLVGALNLPRDPSRLPLAGAFFNMDLARPHSFSGLEVEFFRNPRRFCAFPLWLELRQGENGISVDCTYNRDLWNAETIRRWLGHFRTLLQAIAADPTQAVGDLPLLSDAERTLILKDWNSTATTLPEGTTLDLVVAQAGRTPKAIAVSGSGVSLTYAQLLSRSEPLAAELVRRGVGPEIAVGVCLERTPEMVVALLAIWKAGGAYLPLDPAFPTERLAQMVEDAQPPVILRHAALRDRLPEGSAEVLELDSFDWESGLQIENCKLQIADCNSLAYILFTSGSTGRPKGVQITHGGFLNFIAAMQREPGISASDRVLAVTTLSFDIAGLELFLPLACGASVVLARREEAVDPALLTRRLEEEGITIFQATPATWQGLLQTGWKGKPGLKAFCGGEAMSPDLARDLLARCAEVWNLYGPTETTVYSTISRVTTEEAGDSNITIGRPIANTDVYVLDARMQPVPIGATGELYIGGTGVSRGYFHRPELDAERFVAHPFQSEGRLYRTGDLARWRPNGELECLGRTDHQVKVRGFRIELGEIESALRAYPGVREAVAIVREDQPGDRRIAAYLIGDFDTAGIRKAVAQRLPEYMLPAAFVTLDEFPLTPNRKVDRKRLPAPEPVAPATAFVAPRDELETQLCRIWKELLRVEQVSIEDTFWELGGHSLLAVKLFTEIDRVFGRSLPLATLFRADTVESLAGLLREGSAEEGGWSPLVSIRSEGSRPILFLVHAAGGNVLDYQLLAQHLGEDQPVHAFQAIGLDGKKAPLESVEEMAAHYLEEIRKVQPRGPYHLGGECFGGMVAYEMAQQLTAEGEEVGFLGLLDSFCNRQPEYGLDNERFRSRVYRHLYEMDLHMGRMMRLAPGEQAAYVWDGVRSKTGDLLRRMVGRRTLQPNERLPAALRAVREASEAASERYVPKTYPGRLSLVLATEMPYRSYYDTRLTWVQLAQGGAEVSLVPGDHLGMIREPHVQVLARTIRTCMDRAGGPIRS